jgi:uncharacterized protein (TIGR02246 family)
MNEPKTDAVGTVLEFLARINGHDADRLAEGMTDDHEFVDALGQAVRGRGAVQMGWRGYFAMCPDYEVAHEEIFVRGDMVAVFGTAGGTIAAGNELPEANRWRIRAAWLAQVRDGKIRAWRVYADNKPVYDILARSR